jgi:hypothetical protein
VHLRSCASVRHESEVRLPPHPPKSAAGAQLQADLPPALRGAATQAHYPLDYPIPFARSPVAGFRFAPGPGLVFGATSPLAGL